MAKRTVTTSFERNHPWWIVWAQALPGANTSGATLDLINVFDQLPGGRRVGTVRSGARVPLIRRVGAAALIQTPDGVQGYVAANFVKEFR